MYISWIRVRCKKDFLLWSIFVESIACLWGLALILQIILLRASWCYHISFFSIFLQLDIKALSYLSSSCKLCPSSTLLKASSVADPHNFDADLDPARHFDAYTDPACHFDADPDPTFHFDADPDPSFQIKAQNLEKVLK
jgi:hypothetical protein